MSDDLKEKTALTPDLLLTYSYSRKHFALVVASACSSVVILWIVFWQSMSEVDVFGKPTTAALTVPRNTDCKHGPFFRHVELLSLGVARWCDDRFTQGFPDCTGLFYVLRFTLFYWSFVWPTDSSSISANSLLLYCCSYIFTHKYISREFYLAAFSLLLRICVVAASKSI